MIELLLDALHAIMTLVGYLFAVGIFGAIAFTVWAAIWIRLYTEPRRRLTQLERQHAAYIAKTEWANADTIGADIEARTKSAVCVGLPPNNVTPSRKN